MRILKQIWRWFDELTGFSQSLGPIMSHPVPQARKNQVVLCVRQCDPHRFPRAGSDGNCALQRLRNGLRAGL